MDAAAFSPVHLTTSYEMLTAFLGHYLGINPLYCYQVVLTCALRFRFHLSSIGALEFSD